MNDCGRGMASPLPELVAIPEGQALPVPEYRMPQAFQKPSPPPERRARAYA